MQKLGVNRSAGRKPEPRFGTPEIPNEHIHLEKLLGRGCFGEVWKGTCFQNPVAIKIPTIQDLTKKQLDSFRREVEIMSSNPHPNICLFMGACTVPGKFKIVTELMNGDLETLLHSNQQLSLYERMKMAKDAALGMNWLHRSTPAIIHRDLKTANLLIERVANKYRVKLCDFGLSEIKPSPTAYLQDGRGGAKGTPLWMPPEVMKGQKFDEKSDVYSFGIVLWEILTRKDPFPHHDDYDAFTEAVCEKHERPPIPDNCPAVLRNLMQECWRPEPSERPNFEGITNQLDIVLIHAAIGDTEGRRFWEQNFLKEEEVDGDEFLKAFYAFLKVELPQDVAERKDALSPYVTVVDVSGQTPMLRNDAGEALHRPVSMEVIKLRCLKELLCVPDKSNKPLVNVEKFGQILNWFGPLTNVKERESSFLDRIVNILRNEWFHGDIEAGEAQRRLSGQMPGCYLIRFSTNPSHPGCYTISRVSSTGQIAHIRISHVPGEGFSVNDDHTYATLDLLVSKLSVPLDLRYPCAGSPYARLVAGGSDVAGYQSVVTHEEKLEY